MELISIVKEIKKVDSIFTMMMILVATRDMYRGVMIRSVKVCKILNKGCMQYLAHVVSREVIVN